MEVNAGQRRAMNLLFLIYFSFHKNQEQCKLKQDKPSMHCQLYVSNLSNNLDPASLLVTTLCIEIYKHIN